jgi:hypothetical protein
MYLLLLGECIQTLSGHLDAVTSLDIDSIGNTLVSGGLLITRNNDTCTYYYCM